MKRFRNVIFFQCLLCTALLFVATAQADPITGVELNDSFDANSTNALNYTNQLAYVLFVSNDTDELTLQFNNNTNFNAYFEYRVDGEPPTATDHYFIAGDYVYAWTSLASGQTSTITFNASQMVEIRSAFGPENDWYFDWTAFNVADASESVPEPATMLLLGMGLMGVGLLRRRS